MVFGRVLPKSFTAESQAFKTRQLVVFYSNAKFVISVLDKQRHKRAELSNIQSNCKQTLFTSFHSFRSMMLRTNVFFGQMQEK